MRKASLPIRRSAWSVLPLATTCLLVLSACTAPAPSATPQPSAAKPAQAEAPAAKPAQAEPPAAKPAQPEPAAAKPAAAASAAQPAELTPLQLALVVNLQYVPVYVGVEKGIFLKHGIDLKVRFMAAGPEALKALQAGEAEVGAGNFSSVIAAQAGGAEIKGFALFANAATVANNDDTLVIIVPPNSPIQKVADLSGKKVGLTVGGAVDPYMRLQLQENGVDPKNVELINATFANMPSVLKSGSVDAALFSEPYGEIYLNEVPGARVLIRGGGKVSFRILAVARNDWLSKNQPVADRFATALAEASQYVRQNQEESAQISTHWLSGMAPEVAKKAIVHYSYDPRFTSLVASSWDQEGQILIDQKRITQPVPLRDGFDTRFVEPLPQKYPQFFSDLKPVSN